MIQLTSLKLLALLIMFETFCVCVVDLEIGSTIRLVVTVIEQDFFPGLGGRHAEVVEVQTDRLLGVDSSFCYRIHGIL